MRRDFDLIRAILLHIESAIQFDAEDDWFQYEHDDQQAVGYSLHLMREQGLITSHLSPEYSIAQSQSHHDVTITWAGHDFLDSIRDDEIWRKTKEGAKQAGGFTFDLLKSLSKGFLKKKIEHHTGIELDL
ncbi:MAG: DUF2513 domain-containing protein [Sphingopyxis sp.]|nr:DUF2513 domain-containing protein [Sphingopyxis sp.]